MKIDMKKLYDIVINKGLLTKEDLLNVGYTEEEINYLAKTNKIILNNSEYKFNDVEGLYHYGVILITHQQYSTARTCFRRCLEINPHHRNALLQTLMNKIKANNFVEALKIFDVILSIEPEINYSENNLYTYLLSLLDFVPEKYTELVNISDIYEFSTEDESEQVYLEKDIQRIIVENRLTLAMSVLNDLMAKYPTYNLHYIVLKELLSKAIDNDRTVKQRINYLIEKEKYYELREYLKEVKKRRDLDTKEYYILILSKVLSSLNETRQIPIITNLHPETLYEAIKGNNFLAAKKFNKSYLKRAKRQDDNDPIRILLNKICDLINEITLEEYNNSLVKENIQIQSDALSQAESPENISTQSRNLDDILFFMKKDALTLEDTIAKYNLSVEESLLLKLLMAQDCYSLGLNTLGDKYLREVSESENPEESVLSMLNEVKATRIFEIDGIPLKRTMKK